MTRCSTCRRAGMSGREASGLYRAGSVLRAVACALFVAAASALASAVQQRPTASIDVDAGTIEGRISPLLYGQFIEFMFEGIKRGLHAELIRNRSFDEEPGATGLSRYWERYPDDRNDDYGISFSWDAAAAVPNTARLEGAVTPH